MSKRGKGTPPVPTDVGGSSLTVVYFQLRQVYRVRLPACFYD
jgi:hypothetical protein